MTVSGISVVVCGVAIVYVNKKRRGVTFATAIALAGVGFFLNSTMLIVFGLLLCGFGCIESRFRDGTRQRSICLMLCSASLFCFFAVPAFNRVRAVLDIRQQTPYVSLIDRVAAHPDAPMLVVNETPRGSRDGKPSQNLNEEFGFRASAIRAIHQTAVYHFLVADDFGVGRMRYDPLWVAQDHGKLIDITPPLRHDSTHVELSDSTRQETQQRLGQDEPLPSAKESMAPLGPEVIARFSSAHRSYEKWFLDDSRLGDVRDVNSVAGFLSHAMTTPNTTPETQSRQAHAPLEYWDEDAREIRRDFTLRKLQLIGLLYHDKPVAYELDTLPELINAKTAPTRDLSSFETEALGRLVAGDPIHHQRNGQTLQMMGALRNVQSCRECHDGPKNQLLGAFSYELFIHEPNRDIGVEQTPETLVAHSN